MRSETWDHHTFRNLKVIIFLGLLVPFCFPASNSVAWNIERLRVPLAACLSRNSFEKPCENDHVFSCFSFLLRTLPFSVPHLASYINHVPIFVLAQSWTFLWWAKWTANNQGFWHRLSSHVLSSIELSLLKTLIVFSHNEKQTGCNLALDWLSLSLCLSFSDVYCANMALDMLIMLEDSVSSFLFFTSCCRSFHLADSLLQMWGLVYVWVIA